MEDRKAYSPELFGKWLRILRGKRSQVSVQSETGVKQYTISTIEAGKIERPSYEDVARLVVHYGVTPNELAALVTLFPLPEEAADETNYTPSLLQAMRELRQVAFEMDRTEQDCLPRAKSIRMRKSCMPGAPDAPCTRTTPSTLDPVKLN